MTRTQTRELAFELLYSLEIQKVAESEQTEQIQLFIEQQGIEEEKVKKYILETTQGIEEHEEEILKNISDNLKEKWEITRISKINITL